MTALIGKDGIVENGLVEQAVEFVRRNTHVATALADGSRREQTWTYPEEAVRETIVNALVHRDYLLSGTTVELSIYEDRLEVDPDVLASAGMDSPAAPRTEVSQREMEKWIDALPREEANSILKQLLEGKGQQAERSIKDERAEHERV